jgi:hypothetical protein
MNRLRRVCRDQSGMSYAFIGMGMMAFMSASMLAIDVGMLMVSRNQAQNAADAGALAGAVALFRDSFTDHTPSGPAVTSAIAAAQGNLVAGQSVSVTPADVEFLMGPGGQENRVKVTVYRTAARGNAVSTLIAKFFKLPGTDSFMETADIWATATAEATPANAMTCVKPFTIPDKWTEKQTPPWDESDTYRAFEKDGTPIPNGDVYIPADKPGYTGYNQERERGMRLTLHAKTGTNIEPSMYFSYAIADVTGASAYEENIAQCNTHIMKWGDMLLHEPGAMAGPTISGINDLIDRDPSAYWDNSTNTIKNSRFSGGNQSPRVFPIPLSDPEYYDTGVRNGRMADLKVANWIGFFAESAKGYEIYGRIIPIGGIFDVYTEAPGGVFPVAIRLVQ